MSEQLRESVLIFIGAAAHAALLSVERETREAVTAQQQAELERLTKAHEAACTVAEGAAKALADAEAAVERLTKERDDWKDTAVDRLKCAEGWAATAERLREGLSNIYAHADDGHCGACDRAAKLAERLLGESHD